MLLENLIDVFKKAHPDMDEHEFFAMITADPTIITNDRGSFCGKYCTWIGSQYVDGKIKAGDIPELHSALVTYNKNKSQLKPIKEVNDLDELIDLVKDLSDDFKPTRCISKGEQGLEKVYEDEEWIVYIPHTFEASRKIGGDTRWCTAASNGQERFDYYTKQGPLYVNVRKSDGEKFQFHFETKQFMDKNDVKIQLKKLELNKNIMDFYCSINQYFNLLIKYREININKRFSDDLVAVMVGYSWTFAHKDGTLFSKDKRYKRIHEVSEGFALVTTLSGGYNYVDQYGTFLLKEDCSYGEPFKYGYAKITAKNCKYNLIDQNGILLFNEGFNSCTGFVMPNVGIAKEGQYWLFNEKGEQISDKYHHIYESKNGQYVEVLHKGMFNFLNKEGKLIFDTWFENKIDIANIYLLRLNLKYYIFDLSLKQLSPIGYDYYYKISQINAIIFKSNNIIHFFNIDETCFYDLVPNNNLLCQ